MLRAKDVFLIFTLCAGMWSGFNIKENIKNWSKTLGEKIVLSLKKFDHISQGLIPLRWLCIEDELLLDAAAGHKCLAPRGTQLFKR